MMVLQPRDILFFEADVFAVKFSVVVDSFICGAEEDGFACFDPTESFSF